MLFDISSISSLSVLGDSIWIYQSKLATAASAVCYFAWNSRFFFKGVLFHLTFSHLLRLEEAILGRSISDSHDRHDLHVFFPRSLQRRSLLLSGNLVHGLRVPRHHRHPPHRHHRLSRHLDLFPAPTIERTRKRHFWTKTQSGVLAGTNLMREFGWKEECEGKKKKEKKKKKQEKKKKKKEKKK